MQKLKKCSVHSILDIFVFSTIHKKFKLKLILDWQDF